MHEMQWLGSNVKSGVQILLWQHECDINQSDIDLKEISKR